MDKKIVYHYCSVETLFSIIKYKKLWLSDARYMNDLYETILIDQIVSHILDDLNPTYTQVELDNFRNVYNQLPYKKHYMMCFSEESDLLSQWRGYGDNGYGVSIGFLLDYDTTGILARSYGADGHESMSVKFGFEQVDYNKEIIRNDIQEVIVDSIQHKKHEHCATLIKDMASKIKHHSFSEEKEWRLTYTPENNGQYNQSDVPLKYIQNLDTEFKINY